MGDRDRENHDTTTRRERELLQALMVVFRSCSLYPDTHVRIESSARRALELLGELLGSAEALPVITTRREVRVGVRRLSAAEAGCDWLIESCERTGLAGLCLSGAADKAELLQFARLLLRNRGNQNRNATFATLWAGDWRGVWPVERRFDGTFDPRVPRPGTEAAEGTGVGPGFKPGAEHRWLRDLLRRDPAVRARLAQLSAALEAQTSGSGPRLGLELIDALVGQMPAEAWKDARFAQQLAVQALDVVGRAVAEHRTRLSAGSGLAEQLLEIARSFFGSRAQHVAGPAPTPGGPLGHAGDELITEDAPALRRELEALPDLGAESVARLGATSNAEILAIHVHLLLETQDPTRRERLLDSLRVYAAASTRAEQAVLAPYLDAARLGAGLARKASALVHTLMAGGLKAVLLEPGALTAELLRASFPGCLLDFLDAIDPANPQECEQFVRLLREIGSVRLGHAEDALAREGALLRRDRIDKLFAMVRAELLPLVQFALQRDPGLGIQARTVAYLRTLKPAHRAAAPLWVVDASQLSTDYLCQLCDGLAAGTLPPPLVDHAAALIRRFIEQAAGRDELVVRREYAIASLGQFPEVENRAFLQRLLDARGRFGLRKESRAIRTAAGQALAAQRQPGGSA